VRSLGSDCCRRLFAAGWSCWAGCHSCDDELKAAKTLPSRRPTFLMGPITCYCCFSRVALAQPRLLITRHGARSGIIQAVFTHPGSCIDVKRESALIHPLYDGCPCLVSACETLYCHQLLGSFSSVAARDWTSVRTTCTLGLVTGTSVPLRWASWYKEAPDAGPQPRPLFSSRNFKNIQSLLLVHTETTRFRQQFLNKSIACAEHLPLGPKISSMFLAVMQVCYLCGNDLS
jgi:hypothetical protein